MGLQGLGHHLSHPLDFVRQRRTRGLQVDAGVHGVRRGEEVEALVTISSPTGLGDLEVGLVCTEYYDEESTDSDGHTQGTRRKAIAHEIGCRSRRAPGVQNVRLAVPAEAPFSYEGGAFASSGSSWPEDRRSRDWMRRRAKGFSVLP